MVVRRNASDSFRRRLGDVLREEMVERMGQMADLQRINEYSGEVIQHYLEGMDRAEEGTNGRKDLEESFRIVRLLEIIIGLF